MDAKVENKCSVMLNESTYTRRCFMTGEYCSQQRNVQKEKQELYEDAKNDSGKYKIKAFVVMDFSDMSNVVYKWRICSFIESLSKYFCIEKTQNERKLHCYRDENNRNQDCDKKGYYKVKEIEVLRADSEPSSNFIICNRVCQQMQIADLIIVDVSRQNPNVFYELGLAIAFKKLILPICFSESYYKIKYPDELLKNEKNEKVEQMKLFKKHIGCFPWRKILFEDYGIIYKEKENNGNSSDEKYHQKDGVGYIDWKKIKDNKIGFDDEEYTDFPYDEDDINYENRKVGETIYNKLRDTYNRATTDNNTLVVYTLEKFMNEEDAGNCIVNYYEIITEKTHAISCFSGDRVGVLVQKNYIPERDKDAKSDVDFHYGIGDIIQIGVNQATYYATERKIKTNDVFKEKHEEEIEIQYERAKRIRVNVKDYVRNRALLVYPDHPIYVTRYLNDFYDEPFSKEYFNMYYIMLETLRYTNQVVIDIGNNYANCIQAFLWLGMAHGFGINAITVSHEENSEERKKVTGSEEKNRRAIVDVAGLWRAVLHSNDTEGFYKQLELVQQAIESHSKLMLPDREQYEKKTIELFSSKDVEWKENIQMLYVKKDCDEKVMLESYYRNRFWKTMLRYNQLNIYMPQYYGIINNSEGKLYTVKWDLDAASELSNYLSKRQMIGDYHIETIKEKEKKEDVKKTNFVQIGAGASPLNKSLVDIVNDEMKKNVVRKHWKLVKYDGNKEESDDYEKRKGFYVIDDNNKEQKRGYFSFHPLQNECVKTGIFEDLNEMKSSEANSSKVSDKNVHTQIGQLILWRECENDVKDKKENSKFRVAIVGTSGPATAAVAELFISKDERKERNVGLENGLYILQEKVREKFMKVLKENIETKLMGEYFEKNLFVNEDCQKTFFQIIKIFKKSDRNKKDDKKAMVDLLKGCLKDSSSIKRFHYINLVLWAVDDYLSTVLYRYFLPFLTERDRNCINNGITSFINHMKAAEKSPFALNYKDEMGHSKVEHECVLQAISTVKDELGKILDDFCGLEVFFEVTVQNGVDNNDDKRKIEKIEFLKKGSDKKEHIELLIKPTSRKEMSM